MGVSRHPKQPAPLSMKVVLFFVMALFLSDSQARDSHVWKTYTNVRFQYSICYPEDLLVPQGEADNSDGQAFLAKDGAKLLVYGRNNDLNQTVREVFKETASRLAGVSGKVTHQVIKPRWFVVSGTNEGKTFDAKVIYFRGQFKSFELTYDSLLSQVYTPVIQQLSDCFATTSQ